MFVGIFVDIFAVYILFGPSPKKETLSSGKKVYCCDSSIDLVVALNYMPVVHKFIEK